MKKSLLLLAAIILTGCSTAPAPVKPPVSTKMATSSAGGVTYISWKSASNETYTVYYTTSPLGKPAEWKPLPQASSLRGTGQQLTVADQSSTEAPRRYILLTGDKKP